MTIVHDTIAAELALLTREVQTPTEPFGYGVDLSCVEELDENLAEVDPNSKLAIGQALVRRLITPRGRLDDDGNYGEDIRSYCNRGVTLADLRDIGARVQGECLKDDRVESCTALATWNASTQRLAISVQVVAVDPAIGLFSLTIAVQNGQAMLEAFAA